MAFTTWPRCRYPVGEGAKRVTGGTGEDHARRFGRVTDMMLIEATDAGLYCAAGGFYIDPWKPVPRAVITHAHGDHLQAGSNAYLCSTASLRLVRQRLGIDTGITALEYGDGISIDGV